MIFHYTFRYPIIYGEDLTTWSFKYGSAIGVTLFFVLSGYFFQKSIDRIRGGYSDFLKKKVIALYPPFVLCLTLTLIVKLVDGNPMGGVLSDYIKNLLFINLNLEGATWYLRSLLALYIIVYPLTRFRLYRYIMPIMLCLLLAFDCLDLSIMNNNIVNSLPKFIIGICLSLYMGTGVKRIITACLLTSLVLSFYMPILLSILSSVILCGLLADYKWPQVIFSNRIFLFLGGISYVMYLLHQNIGYILISHLKDIDRLENGNIILIVTIAIVICLSYLVNLAYNKCCK